ncbi:polysialyltransferase family glycosyltransferase [Flavobacterium buctense]|uniref:Polysialyltransferase family glycosyltransferase n=1 Tax=Flavobacterium buctense TaxID=1648146 RepID=A0ABU9E2V2_9FLAO|nr:polysialyltransferase family glycosyltransferase [Flavobacterium buctense]
MKMKKTNVFLVRTQYHVLMAVNTIFSEYKDYNNIIYYLKGRINNDLESNEDFIDFKKLERNKFGNTDFVKHLKELNPKRFFFFQENCSETLFLLNKLSKTDIIISLLQDGTKPYHHYKKKRLLYCILRDTLNDYKEMYKRKQMALIGFHNNYKYAFSKEVDEVWLTYPERYNNRTKKKLIQLPYYSEESIKFCNQLFNFKVDFDVESILYLGQAWKRIYWEREKEIFDYLIQKYPERKIIYKAHPNSEPGQLELYNDYKNIVIIKDIIPAELYVLTMKNTIILSAASTSMFVYNETCKFYYTYKLYQFGNIFTQVDIGNPTDYIVNIDNMNEIVF